jgi:hypothetical protein
MTKLIAGLALLTMTGVAYATGCCAAGMACCGGCPLC